MIARDYQEKGVNSMVKEGGTEKLDTLVYPVIPDVMMEQPEAVPALIN